MFCQLPARAPLFDGFQFENWTPVSCLEQIDPLLQFGQRQSVCICFCSVVSVLFGSFSCLDVVFVCLFVFFPAAEL